MRLRFNESFFIYFYYLIIFYSLFSVTFPYNGHPFDFNDTSIKIIIQGNPSIQTLGRRTKNFRRSQGVRKREF